MASTASTANGTLPKSDEIQGGQGAAMLISQYPPVQGTLAVTSAAKEIKVGGDFAITGKNFGIRLKAVTDDVWLLFKATGNATAGTATEILLQVADGWVEFPFVATTRISVIRATNDATLHIMELGGVI